MDLVAIAVQLLDQLSKSQLPTTKTTNYRFANKNLHKILTFTKGNSSDVKLYFFFHSSYITSNKATVKARHSTITYCILSYAAYIKSHTSDDGSNESTNVDSSLATNTPKSTNNPPFRYSGSPVIASRSVICNPNSYNIRYITFAQYLRLKAPSWNTSTIETIYESSHTQ